MSNVLTWKAALDSGCEPRLYPYTADDVPMGQYEAVLDFKIWAVRAYTLNCYFTEVATGKKFQLSVYRRDDEIYGLSDGEIDFKESPVSKVYLITVSLNAKSKAVFRQAELKKETE
jgi:hypothetical protein